MATKKQSKRELASRYDGRVESDDIVNEQQWRAIQRFGGGKVAAEKARKVAMERLKKLTGKDVAFEYMFANTDDVPLPPPPPRDPLFDDEVASPRIATRTYHSRSPSQSSRSNSPRRSVSTSPERTPRESNLRRSPRGSFNEASTTMPKPSVATTAASTPPHGRDLRPAEFRKGAHLPNYSSPPDTASTRSPERARDEAKSKSVADDQGDTSPQQKSGLARRISPSGGRTSQDPTEPTATQSPTRQAGRPRPASASPGAGRPGHKGRGWRPGGTEDTLRGRRSEERKQHERKLQEWMHRSVSPGKGYTGHSLRRSEIRSSKQWRKSAEEEEFYKMWRAGRADPKTPPWKHSQPQSSGPMVPIEVVMFNFDEAHPAVAEEHYKRTKEQNEMIEAERKAEELRSRKVEMKVERDNALETISRSGSRAASRAGSRSVSYSGGVSPPLGTARSMSRTSSRPGLSPLESEMYQVRAMEREAEELKRRTREAQSRAQNAIKTSGQQSSLQRQQRGIPSAPPPRRVSPQVHSPPMVSSSPSKPQPAKAQQSRESQSALDVDALTQKVEALARGIASQGAENWEAASSESFPASEPPPRRSSLSSRTAVTPRELAKTVSFDGYSAADTASLRGRSPDGRDSNSSPDGSPGRTSQAETEVMAAWLPQRIMPPVSESQEEMEEDHDDDGERRRLHHSAGDDMNVMVAAGKFDPQRYDDYRRAVDAEMEERLHKGLARGCIEDGYNSDLEREQEELDAAEAAEAAALEAELQKYPERRGLQAEAEQVEILREEWLKQDDWMDYYRQGPEYNEDRQQSWQFETGESSSSAHGHGQSASDSSSRHQHGHHQHRSTRSADDDNGDAWRASQQDGANSPTGSFRYSDTSEQHQPPRPLPKSPPISGGSPHRPPLPSTSGQQHNKPSYYANDTNAVRHGFSADDLELLNSEYIPFIQSEYPVYAIAEDRGKDETQQGRLSPIYTPQYANYHSEGEDRGDGTVFWPLTKPRKRNTHKAQHRTLRCTVPQPFAFEHRDATRRKPIIAAKLEAELALKRQEEHCARTKTFRASPFPKSTMEPRFSMLMEEWETMRASNRECTRQWFKAIEAPFSFYYTDKLRTEAKKEVVKKMTNPDRFQKRFRAKPPPEHVFEDRFKELMQEQEDKKVERRVRAEEKLSDVAMPRGMEERMEVSQRRMRERRQQRRVDPEWQTKYPKYPLGYMPNFNELHQEMAFDLAKERARVRRAVTVPEEFNIGGRTREEAGTRKLRALERKKAIELDMLRDQDDLPETRWPYATPRGKVMPSAIPATRSPAKDAIRQTHTSMLRASNTRQKLSKAAEKDRAREEAEAEQHRQKAKALVKKRMQERVAQKAAATEDEDTLLQEGTGGDGTAGTSAAAEQKYAQPMQYVEARHKQAGERGRQIYEDSLLQHGGIDAYRYVEGAD